MRKLSDEETVVLNVKMPRSERDRIDQFAADNKLLKRSDAARALIERGLAHMNGAA